MNYHYVLCDGMCVYGYVATFGDTSTALEIAVGGISYYRLRGGDRAEALGLFVSAVNYIYRKNMSPTDWGRAEYDYEANALNVAEIIRQRGYRRADAVCLVEAAVRDAFSRPEY
ncbi:MAG: hypothetical protein ACOYMS_11250 [Terrimicrobiaceae bacterium]